MKNHFPGGWGDYLCFMSYAGLSLKATIWLVFPGLLLFQINASSTDDGLNFYDSGHRFEHLQILLVLLHSLPYASRSLQIRALQVLILVSCTSTYKFIFFFTNQKCIEKRKIFITCMNYACRFWCNLLFLDVCRVKWESEYFRIFYRGQWTNNIEIIRF